MFYQETNPTESSPKCLRTDSHQWSLVLEKVWCSMAGIQSLVQKDGSQCFLNFCLHTENSVPPFATFPLAAPYSKSPLLGLRGKGTPRAKYSHNALSLHPPHSNSPLGATPFLATCCLQSCPACHFCAGSLLTPRFQLLPPFWVTSKGKLAQPLSAQLKKGFRTKQT